MFFSLVLILWCNFNRIQPMDFPKLAGNLVINSADDSSNILKSLEFMKKYGYIPKSDNMAANLYDKDYLKSYIKSVQKFGDLPQTGELDASTMKLMSSPRCGVADVGHANDVGKSRSKRYILSETGGWKKRYLTYFVANWPGQLGPEKVKEELRRAFDHWGDYSYLRFREILIADADIVISFGSYYHGDSHPFDGPGMTLAHAYFPHQFDHLAGDVHFDESENWVYRPNNSDHEGSDFFSVAVHEIGHSLGLRHSHVRGSIMFPYYKGVERNFALDYDDMLALYELYIETSLPGDEQFFRSLRESEITSTTTSAPDPKIDSEKTYVSDPKTTPVQDPKNPSDSTPKTPDLKDGGFQNDKDVVFYRGGSATVEDRERKNGKDSENRRKKEEKRKRVEKKRQAEKRRNDKRETKLEPTEYVPNICDGNFGAIAYIRGEYFILKDQYLWRFRQKGVLSAGYPEKIFDQFNGLPKDVQKFDAIYENKFHYNFFFFTGKYYYVIDGTERSPVGARPITDLGIQESVQKIEAVFHWPKNQKFYLFSGDQYWRADEETNQVEEGYPKDIERWNGIPSHIDAALTDENGTTTFFEGKKFWEFDNNLKRPTAKSPYEDLSPWTGPCRT